MFFQKTKSKKEVEMKRQNLLLLLILWVAMTGFAMAATLTSIQVTPSSPTIVVGTTQQFAATGTYSDGTIQDITTSATWSSSESSVATISNQMNSKGLATSAAIGTTIITARYRGIEGMSELTVTGAINLPKTGLISSYYAGDDGELQKGIAWPIPRFSINVDTTITDNLTGLVWTPDAGTPAIGSCIGGMKDWQGALNYVECLNTNSYLGYTDWRLPNVNELGSLFNGGQADSAAWLNTQGFSNVLTNYYWSATTRGGFTSSAWVATFRGSYTDPGGGKSSVSYYVWPVRTGQGIDTAPAKLPKTGQSTSYAIGDDGDIQKGVTWPNPRFTAGTGAMVDCVKDNLTGLMWVKSPDSIQRSWSTALDYSTNLTLCGYSDWRLPNKKELMSLFNAEQAMQSGWLNAQGFNNVVADYYWSSTTNYGYPSYVWIIRMDDGAQFGGVRSALYYALPVRGGQ